MLASIVVEHRGDMLIRDLVSKGMRGGSELGGQKGRLDQFCGSFGFADSFSQSLDRCRFWFGRFFWNGLFFGGRLVPLRHLDLDLDQFAVKSLRADWRGLSALPR